ncbi:MAG: DNA repair protein RecN [Bacteroidales bacterium]|nr:DNA repair protein RecN [Candidatus Egerieousia equi]
MLSHLSIQNYALIEHLEIDFPAGLVIITGETGAGKSILLGALSLLMGSKFDSSHIKDTSRNCVVEGEFTLGEEQFLVRRVISAAGRSRCFVNDEPVTIGSLSELGSKLIDIHAQHQHLLLCSPEFQMNLVDLHASNSELRASYSALYNELESRSRQLAVLEDRIAAALRDKDYNEFQYSKLADANLRAGELEELEQEQNLLANAENIRLAIEQTVELLNPMGTSFVQNLKMAASKLEKQGGALSLLSELAGRLESCRIECKDIEQELEDALERCNANPQRLEQLDGRIAALEDLMRRFSCSTVEELIAKRDELGRMVNSSDDLEQERSALLSSMASLENELKVKGRELSASRTKAASELGVLLSDNIRSLELPFAEFAIEVVPTGNYGKTGCDRISFMFNANKGGQLVDISKVASGGELSRVMLCVKYIMASYTGMPTMIFDEIDTGVSGRAADKMGKLINDLGRRMQVIAITHLPQIASKGNTHYQVYKTQDSENSRTNIRLLDEEQRIEEIASMLSGSTRSAAAYENAKYLLNNK